MQGARMSAFVRMWRSRFVVMRHDVGVGRRSPLHWRPPTKLQADPWPRRMQHADTVLKPWHRIRYTQARGRLVRQLPFEERLVKQACNDCPTARLENVMTATRMVLRVVPPCELS